MKNNVIPRSYNIITAEQLTESSGGRPGDIWKIKYTESGPIGTNTRTGKTYRTFINHLRNGNYYRVLDIERR